MRVGIVSHWWGQSNYGQKLQAYALQRFLSEKGLEAYHIRYWFDSPFLKFYPVINSLINSFQSLFESKRIETATHRQFDVFERKNLGMTRVYSSKEDLCRDLDKFDFLITGSDQVWAPYVFYRNGRLDENQLDVFTLNLDSRSMKFSYAASCGKFNEQADTKLRTMFIERVSRLDGISLREESDLPIFSSLSKVKEIEVVPDPVFLFSGEIWKSFALETLAEHDIERYNNKIVVYGFWDKGCDFLDNMEKEFGDEFVYINGYGKGIPTEHTVFPTVQEWLLYICNAKCVITSSFHGTAFSILFNTPFISLLVDNRTEPDGRLKQLYKKMGIDPLLLLEKESWKTRGVFEVALNHFEWNRINFSLCSYSMVGKQFLYQMLNGGMRENKFQG